MRMKIGAKRPSLEGATEWLNATAAHAEAEAEGHPTLVHFWAMSCGLCKRNLPRVAELRDRYGEAGLRVVAVHTPLAEEDEDVEEVRMAVARHRITEPCAVDNERRLRDAFGNEEGLVPAYYLFDAEGSMRLFAGGEPGLNMLASALERMFSSSASSQD